MGPRWVKASKAVSGEGRCRARSRISSQVSLASLARATTAAKRRSEKASPAARSAAGTTSSSWRRT